MTASRPTRRRSRGGSPAAAEALARLTAAREHLDADAAERRRREDALIQDFATATGEAADVAARRDAALAELDRQIRAVHDQAAAALAAVQARKEEVLVQLHTHRTAEELAAWFGLPPKRLRHILRTRRANAMGRVWCSGATVRSIPSHPPTPPAAGPRRTTRPPPAAGLTPHRTPRHAHRRQPPLRAR